MVFLKIYVLLIGVTVMMHKYTEAQVFPEISAETLSGEKVVFPDVSKGKITFILIAFKRQTQGEVDSWLDPFLERYRDESSITFYEIPMISSGWKFISGWIDSGMRSGVPRYKHPHVATYYGPLSDYFEVFNIEDKTKCYVFLLDTEGKIVWRNEGAADRNKFSELTEVVDKMIPS